MKVVKKTRVVKKRTPLEELRAALPAIKKHVREIEIKEQIQLNTLNHLHETAGNARRSLGEIRASQVTEIAMLNEVRSLQSLHISDTKLLDAKVVELLRRSALSETRAGEIQDGIRRTETMVRNSESMIRTLRDDLQTKVGEKIFEKKPWWKRFSLRGGG